MSDLNELDAPTAPEQEVPAQANGHAPEVEPGSLLDQLVQRRQAIADDTTEDFEVPNNAGLLMVTYKLLPWRQVRSFADVATGRDKESELSAACDMIGAACVEVWLRNAEGERQPWPGRDPSLPLRFHAELLDYLRIPLPPNGARPRDVIRLVFQRDLAVTAHQMDVVRWMEGENDRVNEEFAGG